MDFLLFIIAVLLCTVAAYFVANAICQRAWKEKIPQSKLLGFAIIFMITFFALSFFMFMSSMLVFGR